jgi:hypothetical protein
MRKWILLGLIGVLLPACASPLRGAGPTTDLHAPATLAEALDRLRQTLPPETTEKMRDGKEDDMAMYHKGLGMWMRNNWGLWANGPLYQHLTILGLSHPDDMSAVILTSFWRQLHGKPIEIEAQVAKYKEYWRLHTPPDPGSNSACAGPVDIILGARDGLQMGKCCADGLVWSYHADRGWYRPTDAEMAVWNKARAEGMCNPCKNQGQRSNNRIQPTPFSSG